MVKPTTVPPALLRSIRRARRGSVEDQQRQRQQILEAASEIFRRDGLHGLTMRAVAAAVGVSPMAIYRYYVDKAELVQGLWDAVMHEVQQLGNDALASQPTALGQLRASTASFLHYWEEHPDHFRLVFMTEQTADPQRASGVADLPSYQRMVDLSRRLMEAVADEVGGDQSRALLARDLRLSMMVGYLHGRLTNHRYPWSDLQALRGQVIESVVSAVVACLRSGTVPANDPVAYRRTEG